VSLPHWILAASVVLAAALAIRAHYLDAAGRWQVYVFKPLATLLVLALALAFPAAPPAYRYALLAGLALSTAGDVFLMLPRERFVAGLASFLGAHLCYLYAFGFGVPFGASALALPFSVAAGVVLALIWRGLTPRLRVPVIVYVVVIALMAGQAAARWELLRDAATLSAALGAALFMASDALLAIDRFRARFASARALTLASYWAAQLLIALSLAVW